MSDSCVTESRYSANLIWETFVSWRLQYLLVVVLLIVFFTCCWRYCIQYWRRRTRDDDDDDVRPTLRVEKVSSRISKPKQIRSIKNKKNRAMDSMLSLPNLNKVGQVCLIKKRLSVFVITAVIVENQSIFGRRQRKCKI